MARVINISKTVDRYTNVSPTSETEITDCLAFVMNLVFIPLYVLFDIPKTVIYVHLCNNCVSETPTKFGV